MNREVRDYNIKKDTTLKDLGSQYYESGGFVAKNIGNAIKILESMFEGGTFNILSFPASIISTGTRGLIKEAVKRKLFDLVVTTCGFLDHDFARAFKPYYHGDFKADDRELYRKKTHRLGNIFIPMKSHGLVIEEKLQPILKELYDSGQRNLSTYEFVWEVGKRMNDESSIMHWAFKNQIPFIIPGITDGAFGLQLTMFMQDHKDFRIDVFKDELFLMDRMFGKFKSGALIIGGGISKHHTIWWNQFKGGLDYAVYITTAPEWDGSLSGARMQEGISWGKVSEKARFVTIDGDATVILPLILGPFL